MTEPAPETHTLTADASLWTAVLTCSCGWRTIQMTRKAAWAAAAYHVEQADGTPSASTARNLRRHKTK